MICICVDDQVKSDFDMLWRFVQTITYALESVPDPSKG